MSDLPFDHPDVQAVLEKVFAVLVVESDRGAALIAAELISENLGKLLQDFFPSDFEARKFLNFPGPLSEAAVRTKASYAFRLISRDLYRAITLLRRVRDAAAHSSTSFSLAAHSDRLREAYEATVTPGSSINHIARRFMSLRLAEVSRAVDNHLGHPTKTYMEEDLDAMLERPEIAQHLPKYQLAVAVGLICALLVYYKNRLSSTLREGTLVAQILQRQEQSAEDNATPSVEAAPNSTDKGDI